MLPSQSRGVSPGVAKGQGLQVNGHGHSHGHSQGHSQGHSHGHLHGQTIDKKRRNLEIQDKDAHKELDRLRKVCAKMESIINDRND